MSAYGTRDKRYPVNWKNDDVAGSGYIGQQRRRLSQLSLAAIHTTALFIDDGAARRRDMEMERQQEHR